MNHTIPCSSREHQERIRYSLKWRSSATAKQIAVQVITMHIADFAQSLATAAAIVAYADGRLHPAERRELDACAQRYVTPPAARQRNVLALFDDRIRRLQRGPHQGTEFLQELSLVAGIPRISIILHAAERIAGADGDVSAPETAALTEIRHSLGLSSDNRQRFAACLLWGFPRTHK
jgi:tellurite resistance protein